jgi:hypothetical protein
MGAGRPSEAVGFKWRSGDSSPPAAAQMMRLQSGCRQLPLCELCEVHRIDAPSRDVPGTRSYFQNENGPSSHHRMHIGTRQGKAPRSAGGSLAGLLTDGEPRLRGDGNPSPSTRLDNAEQRSRVPIGNKTAMLAGSRPSGLLHCGRLGPPYGRHCGAARFLEDRRSICLLTGRTIRIDAATITARSWG